MPRKYGYSPHMVKKTIEEAADLVEQVPVREVFNWSRLVSLAAFALLATVGI